MRVLTAAFIAALATPAMAGAAPLMTATTEAGTDGRIITRGAAWDCSDGACKTASDASRPKVLCERLVKEIGALNQFTVDGKAWDEESLAKCNAKAK